MVGPVGKGNTMAIISEKKNIDIKRESLNEIYYSLIKLINPKSLP